MIIPSSPSICRSRLHAARCTHSMSIVRRVTSDVRGYGGVKPNFWPRVYIRRTVYLDQTYIYEKLRSGTNEGAVRPLSHLRGFHGGPQKTYPGFSFQRLPYRPGSDRSSCYYIDSIELVRFASSGNNRGANAKEEKSLEKNRPKIRYELRSVRAQEAESQQPRQSKGSTSTSRLEKGHPAQTTSPKSSTHPDVKDSPINPLDKLAIKIHRADVKRRLEANKAPSQPTSPLPEMDEDVPEKSDPFDPPSIRRIHKTWVIPELADPPPVRYVGSKLPAITEPEWDKYSGPPPVRRPRTTANKAFRPWPANVLPWLEPKDEEQWKALTLFLEELHRGDDLDELFKYYQAIPSPRLPYLEMAEIHLLLSRYLGVHKRTDRAMLQYIIIMDEMRTLELPIMNNEWTQVLIYIGQRFNRKVEQAEVEAVLAMWRDSDKHTDRQRSATIFNVLLDIAVNGKQPSLVTAILDEMKSRNISHDRYTHTTLLKWYGKTKNKKAVMDTFRRLVSEGQIVDTVILNSLISALLTCLETLTAEQIYQRMRNYGAETIALPISPFHVNASRRLAKRLKNIGNYNRKQRAHLDPPPETGAMIKKLYCGPNIVTINTFLKLYCFEGDLSQAKLVFSDMEYFQIAPEPSVYISMARGFVAHGAGQRGRPEWTPEALEHFYGLMMGQILADKTGAMVLNTTLVCEWIMAFALTTRDPERVMEVYRDMQILWRQGKADKKEMDWIVTAVLQRALGRPVNVKSISETSSTDAPHNQRRITREDPEAKRIRERYLVGFRLSAEMEDSQRKVYSAEEAKDLLKSEPSNANDGSFSSVYRSPAFRVPENRGQESRGSVRKGENHNIKKTFSRIVRNR